MLRGELVAFKFQPCLMYSVKLSRAKPAEKVLWSSLSMDLYYQWSPNPFPGRTGALAGSVARQEGEGWFSPPPPPPWLPSVHPEQPHSPGWVLPCFSSLLSSQKVQLMEPGHLNTNWSLNFQDFCVAHNESSSSLKVQTEHLLGVCCTSPVPPQAAHAQCSTPLEVPDQLEVHCRAIQSLQGIVWEVQGLCRFCEIGQ